MEICRNATTQSTVGHASTQYQRKNQASKVDLEELQAGPQGVDQTGNSKFVRCWFYQAYKTSNLCG